jgi:hypothetical protein
MCATLIPGGKKVWGPIFDTSVHQKYLSCQLESFTDVSCSWEDHSSNNRIFLEFSDPTIKKAGNSSRDFASQASRRANFEQEHLNEKNCNKNQTSGDDCHYAPD